jgi:hypothetical protein
MNEKDKPELCPFCRAGEVDIRPAHPRAAASCKEKASGER